MSAQDAAASALNRQRRALPALSRRAHLWCGALFFLHRKRFDCGVPLVQNLRRGNKEAARAVGGRLLPRATQDRGSPDAKASGRLTRGSPPLG
jgi:hypothetical protein